MKNRQDFDEKLLLSRAQDQAQRAARSFEVCFLPFLSDTEQAYLEAYLSYPRDDVRLVFFGGHEDADYKCAGFFPSFLFFDESFDPKGAFPITALECRGSSFRKLTHRDFLGSLMSHGLKRETLGDIIVSEDGYAAFVFALSKTAEYIIANFDSAANDRITVKKLDLWALKLPERKYQSIAATVNSLRIDALLCACLDVSREEADRLLRAGFVSRNHIICTEKSRAVDKGDLFSIRHHGRFLLYDIGDRNRRDRLRITIHKYI